MLSMRWRLLSHFSGSFFHKHLAEPALILSYLCGHEILFEYVANNDSSQSCDDLESCSQLLRHYDAFGSRAASPTRCCLPHSTIGVRMGSRLWPSGVKLYSTLGGTT